MLKNYKNIVKDHNFRHRYLYDKNRERVGVVVLVKEDKNGVTRYYEGYSICSKLEPVFNKDLGKAIAILRALSDKADFEKIPVKFREQAKSKLPPLHVNY